MSTYFWRFYDQYITIPFKDHAVRHASPHSDLWRSCLGSYHTRRWSEICGVSGSEQRSNGATTMRSRDVSCQARSNWSQKKYRDHMGRMSGVQESDQVTVHWSNHGWDIALVFVHICFHYQYYERSSTLLAASSSMFQPLRDRSIKWASCCDPMVSRCLRWLVKSPGCHGSPWSLCEMKSLRTKNLTGNQVINVLQPYPRQTLRENRGLPEDYQSDSDAFHGFEKPYPLVM